MEEATETKVVKKGRPKKADVRTINDVKEMTGQDYLQGLQDPNYFVSLLSELEAVKQNDGYHYVVLVWIVSDIMDQFTGRMVNNPQVVTLNTGEIKPFIEVSILDGKKFVLLSDVEAKALKHRNVRKFNDEYEFIKGKLIKNGRIKG